MSFNDAFKTISQLVKDFKENEKHYLNTSYSEADVRNDFINKFFIALGWDVRHEIQKNPYEQEVRVEKPVQIAKAQKRADYTFYLSPNFRDVKFFVEAKKPYHDLENKDYFFQTVRYGWNANTPVAVLTDFEEFIILDCRFRPDINNILSSKIKSFHYSDYANEDKLKEIYFLFGRDAVADSSIEKYAAELPKPKGKAVQRGLFKGGFQPIDESFLEEIDEIRTSLAKSFKKNNSHLTSEELTEATQRTIDRLVFIKFLEDKLIEPDHYISNFGDRKTVWEDFISASRTLDAKYNGVVFKKSLIDTRNIVEPDEKTFSQICEDLSHENTPYDFDKIPIHILGSIYERFLGKVVNATDKRVTIEEKPEVRKAGGVYYTPQYIVNYIVDNTVVKLITGDSPFGNGKTPKEIAKLKFADIACGSGSFLITVYERLIDYHKQYYQQNPEQAKKDGCVMFEGAYRLTLKQKQKILLNNIYGVDLDQQAVEVTQLSLYLKLLEDETTATANDTWVMFKEKLLPDLNKNIVCGNSLIGTDIIAGKLFDYDEEKKLKPMDFESVFPEVVKSGGFDAIVGNPPYVKARDYDGKKDVYRDYLNSSNEFKTLNLMWDLYIPFLEKAITLLKIKGELGYIIPNTLENAAYAGKIKKYIIEKFYVPQIDFFPESYIFKSAKKVIGVKNIIIFVSNTKGEKTKKVIHKKNYTEVLKTEVVPYGEDIFTMHHLKVDLTKNSFLKLEDICIVSYGLRLNSDKADRNYKFKKSDLISDVITKNHRRGFTEGKYLSRYIINRIKYVEWDTERCPRKLVRPTFRELYEVPKIVLGRQTRNAAFDKEKLVVDNTIMVCILHKELVNVSNSHLKKYYTNIGKEREELISISKGFDLLFLLGVINSSVTKYFLRILTKGKLDAYPDDWKKIIIPLGTNNLRLHINNLVEQLLTAKQKLQQAKTESDKNYLERKCETLDRQIDALVYELYGLTEEEIGIVEGERNK